MVETLVIAVAFFCGTAPMWSLEHTSAQGLLTRLAVPASCPQPRAPLWLELNCGKESCAGQITQGTEAGHAHAALATIEGTPASLKIKFTPEEGPLLSKLRLSVTARRPLGAEEARTLAPVLAPATVARIKFGNGSSEFSGKAAGVLGSIGPKGLLAVALRVDDGGRSIELRDRSGKVLLRVPEGSQGSVECAAAGGLCTGAITVSAEKESAHGAGDEGSSPARPLAR